MTSQSETTKFDVGSVTPGMRILLAGHDLIEPEATPDDVPPDAWAVTLTAMRATRLRWDWGQVDAADAAGVSQSTFAALEAGKRVPRADTLSAVLDALDIDEPVRVQGVTANAA